MKKIILLFAIIVSGTYAAKAQAYATNSETSLEISATTTAEDLLNVRYFYYPNLQAYYDRQTSTYLYTRNGKDWIESGKLPNGLRGYSTNNGKRVPLTDYSGDEPYELLDQHKKQYPANYETRRQPKKEEIKQDKTLVYSY